MQRVLKAQTPRADLFPVMEGPRIPRVGNMFSPVPSQIQELAMLKSGVPPVLGDRARMTSM